MNYLILAMEEPLPMPGPMTPAMRETLIVIGAMLLVAIGLLVWAGAIRKRHRRRSAPHRPHYERGSGGDHESHHSSGRRRRRRRREHRPRNPTLAETGGLPPIRTEPSSRPPQPPLT
ncbi:MAG: hypothetical protein KJ070_17850 [Verrucomicrobia bacterium]|nr:hypothetical protein [Verrucomicrobiota bacterium]